MQVENLKPKIGARVHAERAELNDPAVAQRLLELLEERGVLVFPRLGLDDRDLLAFTDSLGARVNITTPAPGGGTGLASHLVSKSVSPR